jgi:hypothetical protein
VVTVSLAETGVDVRNRLLAVHDGQDTKATGWIADATAGRAVGRIDGRTGQTIRRGDKAMLLMGPPGPLATRFCMYFKCAESIPRDVAQGTVVDVDASGGSVVVLLAEISVNLKGRGFTIHDGSGIKAYGEITAVTAGRALGRIDDPRPDQAIRQGDEATLGFGYPLQPFMRPTDVDGTVLEVNAGLGTLAILFGENQWEVQKGWRFAIHDTERYKGMIWITDVSGNMAHGKVESLLPGRTIERGDKATSRLR